MSGGYGPLTAERRKTYPLAQRQGKLWLTRLIADALGQLGVAHDEAIAVELQLGGEAVEQAAVDVAHDRAVDRRAHVLVALPRGHDGQARNRHPRHHEALRAAATVQTQA